MSISDERIEYGSSEVLRYGFSIIPQMKMHASNHRYRREKEILLALFTQSISILYASKEYSMKLHALEEHDTICIRKENKNLFHTIGRI